MFEDVSEDLKIVQDKFLKVWKSKTQICKFNEMH